MQPYPLFLNNRPSAGGEPPQGTTKRYNNQKLAIKDPVIKYAFFSFLCSIVAIFAAPTATADAESLFETVKARVFQVQVIDIASGDKYSIGSGFLVSATGQVATNFHVVSSYVHEPAKYRLEYVGDDGASGAFSLSSIDVVHDLAILHIDEHSEDFLPLARGGLQNGNRIYSMGNPLDLGMTIVEGTYNGLVENSRYRKILFSGSLNAGMSGGPALNAAGEVIGVNVSKGGEQISFLVPVNHLQALLAKDSLVAGERNFQRDINSALLGDQQGFYEGILSGEVSRRSLGDLEVPDKLEESLNCWGHTQDEEDARYEAVHQHCRSEDQIYISRSFYTGDFTYDFEFIKTDELNRFQFYTALQERFSHRNFLNTNDEDEVTEFRCHTDVVGLDSGRWKISNCFRAYRNYDDLYDGSMTMASVDHNHRAAVVKISATGISLENARAVFRRVAESVRWKP